MIYYIRDESNNLIGFTYENTNNSINNGTYYYIKNAQNDIIEIVDSENNKVAKYLYDAYGNHIYIKDGNDIDVSNDLTHIANINPYRYRSYYYDNEIALYYLNSRYYFPKFGRFINADHYISTGVSLLGHNMYTYSNNNPISMSDTNGNGAIWNWVKNKVVKPLERSLIQMCTAVTSLFGLGNSSILLSNSLRDNPKDLYYDSTSKIAKDIQKSTEFVNTINTITQNNINRNFDNDNYHLKFTSLDLKLGLQNTNMYISGQLNNGVGNLSIRIEDKYDFKYEKYGELSINKWILSGINNAAWIDQMMGVIRPYDIVIQFDYCVNCD